MKPIRQSVQNKLLPVTTLQRKQYGAVLRNDLPLKTAGEPHKDYKRIEVASRYKFSQARGKIR